MTTTTEAEYFVGRATVLYALFRMRASKRIRLVPEEQTALEALERELPELSRRAGFSVRLKINTLLGSLGYPALDKGANYVSVLRARAEEASEQS